MKLFKRFTVILCSVFAITVLNSCGQWYYCTVSGYGEAPIQTTYYVVPMDSNLTNSLEYREYANILKTRLDEAGYVQTSPDNAALCIRFGYYMNEKEYAGTQTTSYGNGFTNGTLNSNTIAKAMGQSTTEVEKNKVTTNAKASGSSSTKLDFNQYTFNSSASTTNAIYTQDIGCVVEALDVKTNNPIWQVEAKDKLRNNMEWSFRKVMPWMITAAQKYFGKSGEEQVRITQKEGKNKGLVWPY